MQSSSDETSSLLSETDPLGVLTLKLNRPHVHNAFNADLVIQLTDILQKLHQAPPRALIITGQGHAFSAGADLQWMQSMVKASENDNQADAVRLATMLRLLDELPCPTVARVNGHAFGGGVGLIACCDLAIGLESVEFGLTEVRLGLAPATIAPFVIPKIGIKHARRLMLTGERFDATQAVRFGLLTATTPPHQLDGHVHDMVALLLAGGPEAQKHIKALIRDVTQNRSHIDLDTYCAKMIASLRVSTEGQEGLQAFLEKRRPSWDVHSEPDA